MLYRVPGDPKTGYDLGVGTGTYGGYVPWVRTLGTGTMRVRCGYGTGTVRGYGVLVQCTHGPYPRTVPVPKSTYLHTVPIPKSTYLRTVPYLTPLGMYTVPPRDAQIENLDFITLKN